MPFPFTAGEILTAANLNAATAGWQTIDEASVSAASSFTITIPSTTYRMIRVVIQGAVATGNNILLAARVNGDATAGLHLYNSADLSADTVATVSTATTGYGIGRVNTNQGNVTELLIYNTDASSACPFKSSSASYHSTEASAAMFMAGGQLVSARTLSSLLIFPQSSTFTGSYLVDGYHLAA